MSIIYPERVFTRQSSREVDRRAFEEYGMPGVVMMENASRGVAANAMRMLSWPNQTDEDRVLILCGGGNNAGDGFATARHLQNAGLKVRIATIHPVDAYEGDAAIMLRICKAMEIPVVDASADVPALLGELSGQSDLVIDALAGTGVSEPVRAPLTDAIEWVNTKQDAPVLAVDTPSGLDCDTGEPLGMAVRADTTVTFVGVKKGFLQSDARRFTGDIRIVSIGVPRELVEMLGERMPG